ncbi:hypothetical protein DYB32_003312 [Aphanomyces invadans]|uniref:Uncharacterized protein n=1 Tax=Aphanomyces invadans TaxID=157072 RepID=A0A3R6VZU4_9STRA|nr:hypothetical protein DYB32_003312 [Aphanomyces invadans]
MFKSSGYSVNVRHEGSKLTVDGIKQAFTKTFRRGQDSIDKSNTHSSGQHHAMEVASRDKRFDIYFRLFVNCSEFFVVGLLLIVHISLNFAGLWSRQTTTAHPAIASTWSTVGDACLLTSTGFKSCSPSEAILTTSDAWAAIGTSLARQLGATLVDNSMSLAVTICAFGLDKGYGGIVFLLSTHRVPDCAPQTAETLVSIAMLETAFDDTDAVQYLLTTYADDDEVALDVRMDTDGSKTSVFANVTKEFVAPNGSVTYARPNHTNWRYQAVPFHLRYVFHYSCTSEVVQGNAWTSHIGELSGLALQVGHTCQHDVSNGIEITVAQCIAIAVMLHLFGGDMFTTLVGVQGVLLGKPVLTYDFLSGLERRRLVMALLVVIRIGGIFYLEITRLYHDTAGQKFIFYVVCAMASGLFTLVVFWIMVMIQHLPSPSFLKGKVIRIFAPFMHMGTLGLSLIIVVSWDVSSTFYEPLWQRSQSNLTFVVQNKTLVSGAYDQLEVLSCVQMLLPDLFLASGIMIILSILYPMVRHRRIYLDLAYFEHNEFLTREFVPSYVTCLPLYESECIKYGNKLFVKASTLAVLGYGIIEEQASSVIEVKPLGTKVVEPSFVVLSLYDLMMALSYVRAYAPRIVCTVQSYQFQAVPKGTKIRKTTKYRLNKGTCVS